MNAPPQLLQMTVSEPWDFGSGPVEMSVVDAADETRWPVEVREGWSRAVDAILSCRHEGEISSAYCAANKSQPICQRK